MTSPDTQSLETIRALYQGARSVLEHDTFADAARAIFDGACAMTGATAGYVALLDETGQENEVLFLEAGGEECTVDPTLPMPIRGLRAETYRSGRPALDNDFMHSQWVGFMPAGHAPLRNVMFAPLSIDGSVVGIMGLANKAGDFTAHDVELAAAFGEFAAIALARSRQLDTLRLTIAERERALREVKTLQGLLPICANCKNIRDEQGLWRRIESYISERADVDFTHGVCEECAEKLYGDKGK